MPHKPNDQTRAEEGRQQQQPSAPARRPRGVKRAASAAVTTVAGCGRGLGALLLLLLPAAAHAYVLPPPGVTAVPITTAPRELRAASKKVVARWAALVSCRTHAE
jgi:hypothetical protein